MAAAKIGDVVYIAGGIENNALNSAMNNFWAIDMAKSDTADFKWQVLPSWPGPTRAFNMAAAQYNGNEYCFYVMGGRRQVIGTDPNSVEFLSDVYEFSPSKYISNKYDNNDSLSAWRKCASMPETICAASCIDIGQSHIIVFGGANDKILFLRGDELKNMHPGFRKSSLRYHTITGTWTSAGVFPPGYVTTSALKWEGKIVIPSGEIAPRVRSPIIWQAELVQTKSRFGVLNFICLISYLAAMVIIGIYFARRNKSTDDFFRGGQRVSWWASGLSIFATMLSSITFVAMPAKVFASDWTFFIINMMAIAVAPFVIYFILPFYRRIDATSAYEYLEKRFNVSVRLFASVSFVMFHVGRMAIVLFLPALALTAITPLSVPQCILLMGVLSVIYCTMGGLEAVIWTEAMQAIVLLGGALLSLCIIVLQIPGGIENTLSLAIADNKFHFINWDFSTSSYMTDAFWVLVIGGIGQNLVPYVSDQAVVQRYFSVPDMKSAKKSIWTNAITVFPATLLFFGLGTALFVFYKTHPDCIDPTFQNDAIFPLFISRELPIGIAGIVVAGIFAAAQSTIATSMHSISTVIVTDVFKRFSILSNDRAYLNLARICTLFFGISGMLLAVLFAKADIKSLWESFMSVLGLFGGSMCGLFLLGIFTKRVGGSAAIIGAFVGVATLFVVQKYTATSILLYATIGIVICVISGFILSLAIPQKHKDLSGLTIHTIISK